MPKPRRQGTRRRKRGERKGGLTTEQKMLVIQRLACWRTPTEVATELKATFGIDVPLTTIVYYDPDTAGTDLSKEFRELFKQLRSAYVQDTTNIAISHRRKRIEELYDLYATDKKRGATALAANHLAQIAKEMGDVYTNRRTLLPGDVDGLAGELGKLLGVGKDELLSAFGNAA